MNHLLPLPPLPIGQTSESQRNNALPIAQRINGHWPGAIFGVREPYPYEIPLSWSEVHHAVNHKVLG